MIHAILQIVGWIFLTTVFFLITLTYVTFLGIIWIWEHTIGRLWQRRK